MDLNLDGGDCTSRFFRLLSNNLQENGPFFPNLYRLSFTISYIPPDLDLSPLHRSPNLRIFTLTLYPGAVINQKDLELFGKMISLFPPSLEYLVVMGGRTELEPLSNGLSSFVLGCGSSLVQFKIPVPLSNEAILRLIKLPNLKIWATSQGPHKGVKSVPPSLKWFQIGSSEALGWIDILAPRHKVGKGQNNSAPARPHTTAGDNLESLEIGPGITVNSELLYYLLPFRKLTHLEVTGTCVEGICNFGWTDDNIRDLAAALPCLQSLHLGFPCSSNTCKNTVASLVSISVNCSNLEDLRIHFNTKDIVSHMNRLIQEGTLDKRPKCNVVIKGLSVIPPRLKGTTDRINKKGKDCVAKGFRLIFPKLAEDIIVLQTSRL